MVVVFKSVNPVAGLLTLSCELGIGGPYFGIEIFDFASQFFDGCSMPEWTRLPWQYAFPKVRPRFHYSSILFACLIALDDTDENHKDGHRGQLSTYFAKVWLPSREQSEALTG